MYWTIKFIEDPNYVQVWIGGKVTLSEIDMLNAEIISNSHWRPGMGLLFDSSKVENQTSESPQMTAVADTVAKMNRQFRESKMAIVVKSDVQYGLARQYQMFAESRSPSRIEVFREEKAAIDWLLNT